MIYSENHRRSESYRRRAVACEKFAKEGQSYELRCEWSDIAIEWHALAALRVKDVGPDYELDS